MLLIKYVIIKRLELSEGVSLKLDYASISPTSSTYLLGFGCICRVTHYASRSLPVNKEHVYDTLQEDHVGNLEKLEGKC